MDLITCNWRPYFFLKLLSGPSSVATTSLLPPSPLSPSKQTNQQKSETGGQRLGELVRVQSPRQRDPGSRLLSPPGGEAVQWGASGIGEDLLFITIICLSGSGEISGLFEARLEEARSVACCAGLWAQFPICPHPHLPPRLPPCAVICWSYPLS